MALPPFPARLSARINRPDGPLGLPLLYGVLMVLAVGAGSGLLAFVVARLGLKGMIAVAGALGMVVALLVVRERALLVLTVLVMSLQVLLYKALGPLRTDVSGGPPGVYIMSIDVLVFLLYALWFFEGTLGRDLRGLWRRKEFLVPVLGALALLPSLVMALDLNLALAELVRIAWAYALYVYIALKVKTRREMAFVVVGLFVIAAVQCALVVLEWRTGRSLGLSLLGEQSDLGVRTIDDATDIPRPSGTMVHAVVLGAVMGPIALMGLSLAINLRVWWLRLLSLGASGMAVIPIVIAQTRAAALGLGVAGLLVVVGSLWTRRISWRPIVVLALIGAMAAYPYRATIMERLIDNLGTDHFSLEIQSRVELNDVALEMAADSPILGIGLNNFETAMIPYERYGLIFADNPVHNIYLMMLSETGIIGLAGFLATFIMVFLLAARLVRVKDNFLKAVGVGIFSMCIFYAVEELLMFSMRLDMPRTLYWLLAGLAIAGWRIAQVEQASREATDVA